MNRLSIFSNFKPSDLRLEPYPYVVIENALDEPLYRELATSYPDYSTIVRDDIGQQNRRFGLGTNAILDHPEISDIWKEFTAYHVSPRFYAEVLDIFGSAIEKLHPSIRSYRDKPLRDFTVGIRGVDRDTDLVLESQYGVNSPVKKVSSVRGPHVDNPVELWAGLLYFRPEEDDSTGGDLEVHRYRGRRYYFIGKAELDSRLVEKVETVPYRSNTLAFFINSIGSIHAVSERSVTDHPRRFVNIIGEFQPGFRLFTLPRRKLLGFIPNSVFSGLRRRMPGSRQANDSY